MSPLCYACSALFSGRPVMIRASQRFSCKITVGERNVSHLISMGRYRPGGDLGGVVGRGRTGDHCLRRQGVLDRLHATHLEAVKDLTLMG
jgi:hypothetical protein